MINLGGSFSSKVVLLVKKSTLITDQAKEGSRIKLSRVAVRLCACLTLNSLVKFDKFSPTFKHYS